MMINDDFKDAEIISTVIKKRFVGNAKFYKEMVNLFFNTITDKLETINKAFISHDKEKLKFAAHYIKGGAVNLGAETISQLAETIELFDEETLHHEKLLQELKSELKKFREYVDRLN